MEASGIVGDPQRINAVVLPACGTDAPDDVGGMRQPGEHLQLHQGLQRKVRVVPGGFKAHQAFPFARPNALVHRFHMLRRPFSVLATCSSAVTLPCSSSRATSNVALLTSIPIQCFMFTYFWVSKAIAGGAEPKGPVLDNSNRPLRLQFYPSLRPEWIAGANKSFRPKSLCSGMVHPRSCSVSFSDRLLLEDGHLRGGQV